MTILRWTPEQKQKVAMYQKDILSEIYKSGDDNAIAQAAYDAKLTCRINQAPYKWGHTDWDFFLFIAGRASGKALCINTPIKTVDGWKLNGDIVAGDKVFDESGNRCNVVMAHTPFLSADTYRLHFSDGTCLDACKDHLWVTYNTLERKAINRRGAGAFKLDWADKQYITTEEIYKTQKYGKRGDTNHCIPVVAALIGEDKDLLIDPYCLGIWLGDGDSACGKITTMDEEILECFIKAGYTVDKLKNDNCGQASRYAIDRKPTQRCPVTGTFMSNGSFASLLKELNLLNNKHIPKRYLEASYESRLQLLKGLMDSDGYIYNSKIEFCNMNKRLAEETMELMLSLGQRPTLSTGRAKLYGKDCGEKYRIFCRPTINVNQLSRKASKWNEPTSQGLRLHHRMIERVEKIEPKMVRCLTVDSPHNMYLAGKSLIPTHNTHSGVQWILDILKFTDQQEDILILSPDYNSIIRVMLEGPSGFIRNIPKWMKYEWRKTDATLEFYDDKFTHYIRFCSSENPEKIRGGSYTRALLDECAAYRSVISGGYQEEIEQAVMALREGHSPQMMVTTTPKNFKWLRDMLNRAKDDPRIIVTTGSSLDNAVNLGQGFINNIAKMDPKSKRYRQEVLGELILDEVTATIDENWIRIHEAGTPLPKIERVAIFCDPGFDIKSIRKNDPCGIIVMGLFWCEEINDWAFLVLDLVIKHMSSPDLEDFLYKYWNTQFGGQWRRYPDLMMIEKNASGETISQYLRKRGVPCDLFYTHNIPKPERFARCTHLIKDGHLWLFGDIRTKYASWLTRYAQKLVEYPNLPVDEDGSAHDEEIDLTSMSLLTAQDNNFFDIKWHSREQFNPFADKYAVDDEPMVNPYAQ